MKVKITNKDYVNHIYPSCTCCDYDLKNVVFDAEEDRGWVIVYGDMFSDGSCNLRLNEVEVIEK